MTAQGLRWLADAIVLEACHQDHERGGDLAFRHLRRIRDCRGLRRPLPRNVLLSPARVVFRGFMKLRARP